jgi:hypothetical protein
MKLRFMRSQLAQLAHSAAEAFHFAKPGVRVLKIPRMEFFGWAH